MPTDLSHLTRESFCYLTTTGRTSERPHTIEIWFALQGQTLYLLSRRRERSDWVQNAWQQPNVTVKIKDEVFSGQARPVNNPAEDALVRQLIGEKYRGSNYHKSEDDFNEWLRSTLPVAVDLAV